MTADGRIYYIDHNSHRTTWEKPRYIERQPTAEESGAKVGPTEQVRFSIVYIIVTHQFAMVSRKRAHG